MPSYEMMILELINQAQRYTAAKPLNLGGIASASGGGGGPPGGFVGRLPQGRVTYDTAEVESSDTSVDAPSLYDNLNHIRYRIKTLEDGGGGPAGGVTQIIAGTNITISPVSGSGVVTINASGGTSMSWPSNDHEQYVAKDSEWALMPSGNFITNAQIAKLAGIETGAEVNVNADWNAVSGDALILNKPTNVNHFIGLVDVPSSYSGQGGKFVKVSYYSNTLEFVDEIIPEIAVDAPLTLDVFMSTMNRIGLPEATTISGGYMTTIQVTKLDGIAAGAEVNVNSDWDAVSGDAQILNKPTIPNAPVNADWTAASGLAEILNKPAIVELFTDIADAPHSYENQEYKLLRVNATADGIEFIVPASGGIVPPSYYDMGTVTGNVAIDLDTTSFSLVMTGNTKLLNPTNKLAGSQITFLVKQDGSGGHALTTGTDYYWIGGFQPNNTKTVSGVDLINAFCDGSKLWCNIIKNIKEQYGNIGDIANLLVWLDANTLALSDGDPVSSWTDQSVNGNHAVQATSGRQPIFKANILNGFPVIRFDGTDDSLAIPVSFAATPYTICVVYIPRNNLGDGRAVNGDSSNWLLGPYSETALYNGDFVRGATAVNGTPVLGIARNHEYFENGVSKGTSSGSGTPGSLFLGQNESFGNVLSGDIAEVVIFDASLSDELISVVSTILMNKYGIV